jgi:hypothetical protein
MDIRAWITTAVLVALVVGLVGVAVVTAASSGQALPMVTTTPPGSVSAHLVVDERPAWTTEPYRGLGAWVDAYDIDPVYVGTPTVSPADVVVMADHGVRTVFVQAARSDDRAAWPISDRWLLAEFLLAAHAVGLDAVAWYLPKWSADDEDLRRLEAMADFAVLGHRFDGVAVDIEWNLDGLEPTDRSDRLVALSAGLRAEVGDAPLGAIVMPPVLTDEINPDFWPTFPWDRLAPLYDVWMPMSYWSFRTDEHADPEAYSGDSISLLRANLGDPVAVVHGIGGVGAADGTDIPDPGEPLADIDDLDGFVASLVGTGAVGGSIYDWATTGDRARVRLAELFAEHGLR